MRLYTLEKGPRSAQPVAASTALMVSALVFFVSVSHSHGDITYTALLSEESTTSNGNDGTIEYSAIASAPAPLGVFAHDFGIVGDTQWTVTWQAPPGSRIEVTAPIGMNSLQLNASFGGGNVGGGVGNFQFTDPMLTVGGLSGDSIDFSLGFVSLAGPGIDDNVARFNASFFAFLNPGDTFSFDSLTFSGTIPASYDGVFATPIANFSVRETSDDGGNTTLPDPGQWVRLTPVPEPSTFAMCAVGLLCLRIIRGRRQASAGSGLSF